MKKCLLLATLLGIVLSFSSCSSDDDDSPKEQELEITTSLLEGGTGTWVDASLLTGMPEERTPVLEFKNGTMQLQERVWPYRFSRGTYTYKINKDTITFFDDKNNYSFNVKIWISQISPFTGRYLMRAEGTNVPDIMETRDGVMDMTYTKENKYLEVDK